MKKEELPVELFSVDDIRMLIKAINNGRPQYMEYFTKGKLPTGNGRYQQIWNYIFKDIEIYFNGYPYKCYKISRGNLWEFIAVYDEVNNILYVLMKEKNFKKIKKEKNKGMHYIKLLNIPNHNIESERYENISLLGDESKKDDFIKDELERMLSEISGKVKLCVDILFSERQNKVTTISANIFDYNLDTIKTYNWNEYIKAEIDEIIDTDEIADTTDEDSSENPLIDLPIRKHINVEVDTEHKKQDIEKIVASKEKQEKKLDEK